jgi:hypothetical protein
MAETPLNPDEAFDHRTLPPMGADNVQLHLFHNHLPQLDEFGFIEWDRESDTISKGPHWEQIEPVLRLCLERDQELFNGWLSDPCSL